MAEMMMPGDVGLIRNYDSLDSENPPETKQSLLYDLPFRSQIYSLLNECLERRLLPESKCGFRRHLATIDMTFAAHQLQEKCQEMRTHLYTTFVDLGTAFDMVNREGLREFTQNFGFPERFTYGDRRVPCQQPATTEHDSSLPNYCPRSALRRRLRDQHYEQLGMDLFTPGCVHYGLTINTDKTMVMHQQPPNAEYRVPRIRINGTKLKTVDNLNCLDSTVARCIRIDNKMAHRISKIGQALRRPQKAV
nr:unnamed protein product [Spirometra erinaceieuropaei]